MGSDTSALDIMPLAIPDVRLITPRRFGDHRGFFSETWSRQAFASAGIDIDFVQDNHSLSAAVGTVRGLHYQSPPHAQDKLVRASRAIHDVAVDLRAGSPSFGALGERRTFCREWPAVLGSHRLRPWFLHADARHRGAL